MISSPRRNESVDTLQDKTSAFDTNDTNGDQTSYQDYISIQQSFFRAYSWTGPIHIAGIAVFSGELTITLDDPTLYGEGDTIVLFEFDSSIGEFSSLYVQSGLCEVKGDLEYSTRLVSLKVYTITCSSTISASSLSVM